MTAPWPYPAPADDGAASHLVVGLPLPDVALPATGGGAVNLAHAGGLAVVFVYPWAVATNQMTLFWVLEMAVFMVILVGALAYAWRKNLLEWV